MEWLTKLWRRLFKRESLDERIDAVFAANKRLMDSASGANSVARGAGLIPEIVEMNAVALAEPLPPPKSWHSAFEDVDPPGVPALEAQRLSLMGVKVNPTNHAEQAMREMERTDRRAQLVAAGLLADAAEADRDQELEEKVAGWMLRGCSCERCADRRRRAN